MGVALLIFITFGAIGFLCYRVGQEYIRLAIESIDWPVVDGKVITSYLQKNSSTERDQNNRLVKNHSYQHNFKYSYKVKGKLYTASNFNFGNNKAYSSKDEVEALLTEYPKDKVITVRYNPKEPQMALLEAGDVAFGRNYVIGSYVLFALAVIVSIGFLLMDFAN